MDEFHYKSSDTSIPPELNSRMDGMLDQLRTQLDDLEFRQQIPIHQHQIPRRLAMAAGWTVLAAVAVFFLLSEPPVSWARMEESFQSVSAFQATFLFHDPVYQHPDQIDLWISEQGSTRLQSANQVVFTEGDKLLTTIELPSLSETATPGKHESFILGLLADTRHFSLQSLVEALPGNVLVELADANVTTSNPKALTVFDVSFPASPEWIRIWALRESGLPIQLKYWSPSEGFGIEVYFSYEGEQPEGFYQPQAFKSEASKPRWQDRPAFSRMILKKDPADHPLTPWDAQEPMK